MEHLSVVLAPDSFKGCLDAAGAAASLAAGLIAARPDLLPICRGLADGGEGTLDCLASAGGCQWQRSRVSGIHGATLLAPWLTLADGRAVIESAQILGLSLLAGNGPGIYQSSSRGLGELIAAALDAGHRDLLIGLGGSACNDAGLGLLTALGAQARDAAGRGVAPDLDGLLRVAAVSLDRVDPRLAAARIVVLCDVNNPLTGPTGACQIYGPQKGLAAPVAADAAFGRFSRLLGDAAGRIAGTAGAGAAGGLGFALAVLGARLVSGGPEIMRLIGLESDLVGASAVVTGEGRADRQTLHGKLPAAVAELAHQHRVPAYLVAGAVAPDATCALREHFRHCISLTELAGNAQAAQADAAHWLHAAGMRIGEMI